MIPLFFVLCIFVLLYFLGYGLSAKLLPNALRGYRFWISPWLAVVVIILSGILLGFAGLNGKQWVPLVVVVLSVISFATLKNFSGKLFKFSLPSIFLFSFMVLITLINLSPLILEQKSLTTLSFGSNDAQAFAIVPDFLVNNSVKDGFAPGVHEAVYTLFPFGYRIGQSIIAVFFMVLFNLEGYQILTVVQSVLFSLAIPLVYVLSRMLSNEKSNLPALVSSVIVGLNVNLLYYLYHNFFGQVIFAGIYLLLIILLLVRDNTSKSNSVIGVVLAALYYSYHEAALFIVLPIVLLVMYELFIQKKGLKNVASYTKIALVTMVLAGVAVIHSIKFALFYRSGDFNSPIGWQAFRAAGSSFINPVEMLGLYSIHNLPEMSLIFVLISSLAVIGIIVYGFLRTKVKPLMGGLLATYTFFFLFLTLVRPNFWVYDRAVSYAIPVLVVFFALGFSGTFKKRKVLLVLGMSGMVLVAATQAITLHKRYVREKLAVEPWMKTLEEIKSTSGVPPTTVYSEQVFNPDLPIWKELWAEYFLEPEINFITSLEYEKLKQVIKDDDLVLTSKVQKYAPPADLLMGEVVWENDFYTMGTVCISDTCLEESNRDLSFIDFENPKYADSLLVAGWSVPEPGHRWIASSEATLRLVSRTRSSSLILEVMALETPQKMTILVDNVTVGSKALTVNWKTHHLVTLLPAGIHHVKLVFSHQYRPAEVIGGFDNRNLSADVKKIILE